MTSKDKYVKVVDLENEFEAGLLEKELEEAGIPFEIHSLHDQAFDGLYQMLHGWGFLAAPPNEAKRIKKIYEEILQDLEQEKDTD